MLDFLEDQWPGMAVAGGILFAIGLLISKFPPEPPPVQAQQGYVIRRGEFTIIDKRANPDRSINPSYMQHNMRYVCTEEK
jgi:hypothetical protein